MKIIKQGKIKEKEYRFECDNCGCVFEAKENEIKHLSQIAIVHDNIYYKAICPYCGAAVYK